MYRFFKIKVGRYILFERLAPQSVDNISVDENVKRVTDFGPVKHNRLGIQQAVMERLLRNNTNLFVFFDKKIPLGMMWGHRGSCYVRGPGIPLLLNDDIVYWFWIETIKEARGKKVFSRLEKVFFSHYSDVKGIVALIEPGNEIMCQKMKKIGFVKNKIYFYIKWGNVSLIFEKCEKICKHKLRFECGNKHDLVLI